MKKTTTRGKNTVMARFQTTSDMKGCIEHDFRLKKPKYLRDYLHHNLFSNNYFNFTSNVIQHQVENGYYIYNTLYKEKNKRNLQKGRQTELLQCIITLTPSINNMILNNTVSKERLEQCFVNGIQAIKNKLDSILNDDIKLYYYVIHYDEKTPHMHALFSNHTKDAEAVFHNIKRSKRLHEFQDVVADNFSSIGFVRGKKGSTEKHLSVKKMHIEEIKELEQEISTYKQQLEENIQILNKLKEENAQLKKEKEKQSEFDYEQEFNIFNGF